MASDRREGRSGAAMAAVLVTAAVLAVGGVAAVGLWLSATAPPPTPEVTVPTAPPPPAPAEAPASPPGNPLSEASPNGPLPVVAADGRTSWREYARPFDRSDKRPRIAVIVDGLATSATLTDSAIRDLPGAVTLAFMPYRKQVGQWISLARESGHEVLLDLPMEPSDPAHVDLGPNGLRTTLDAGANIGRLEWMMGQASGYVGMVGYEGGRFVAQRPVLQPVLEDIRRRGLLYIDNRAAAQNVAPAIAEEIGLPFAATCRQLDTEDPARNAVDLRLKEVEAIARRDGAAIAIGSAEPSVIERVAAWASTLEPRGLVLAPVSAIVAVAPTAPPKPVAAAPQR